jgi:thioesterase domain-containing protein/acyl carrier protein
MIAPVSFDASTFEIWGPLLHGGCCVVHPERHLTLEGLEKVIRENSITSLFLTTTLFNEIIDQKPEILRPVQQLITGGEALSPRHIRKALAALPATRLLNGYGPTESTTFTTVHPIPQDLPPDMASIPIGKPIANTRCYVLDTHRQPVPIGIPGELYIGGDGLANGYWNRPDLDAERFVADPFSTEPGARLYRTGDRVAWRTDGTLEFFGRLDNQIKIRGHRIELGEIEIALSTHPDVLEAIVVPVKSASGDLRLSAFVVRAGANPAPDLRAFLRQGIPDYMVPSSIISIQSVPLDATGKADRKALAAMPTTAEPASPSERPSDLIEANLIKIWQDVLGVDPVGLTENFFDLGGHSLLALKLAATIERELGYLVRPQDVFATQTIREMAAALRTRKPADQKAAALVALQTKGTKPPLYFVYQGLSFYNLAREFKGERPCYGVVNGLVLATPESGGPREAELTVEAIAAHFVTALLRKPPQEPVWLAGFSFSGLVAVEMARQLRNKGIQVAPVIIFDMPPMVRKASAIRTAIWNLSESLRALFRNRNRIWPAFRARIRKLRLRSMVRKGTDGSRLSSLGADELKSFMSARYAHIVTKIMRGHRPAKMPGSALVIGCSETYRRRRFVLNDADLALGWGDYFADGVTAIEIQGDHGDLFEGENTTAVAAVIRDFARRWEAGQKCVPNLEPASSTAGGLPKSQM